MRTNKILAQAIDSELLENGLIIVANEMRRAAIQKRLHNKYLTDEQINEMAAEYERAIDAWHEANRAYAALESVHRAYNWNRAWIVSGGHVHKVERGCPGFKANTTAHLLPQCSALTEDEIVDLAGERACTHCFPSAPVDKLAQPSKLFALDEAEKAERKAERLTKAQEREDKKVVVVYPERRNREGYLYTPKETFGTVRSARTEALQTYEWLLWGLNNHQGVMAEKGLAKFRAITKAIISHRDCEFGHIDELEADLVKRSEAKFVKNIMVPDTRVQYKGMTREEAKAKLVEVNEKMAVLKAELDRKNV